jgi:hypothetical protein
MYSSVLYHCHIVHTHTRAHTSHKHTYKISSLVFLFKITPPNRILSRAFVYSLINKNLNADDERISSALRSFSLSLFDIDFES